jgi:hypothetical protein
LRRRPPDLGVPGGGRALATVVGGGNTLVGASLGAWWACQPCSDLVEAGDWPALARRSLRESGIGAAIRYGQPGLRVRLLAMIGQTQRRFRDARTGERRWHGDGAA